MSSNRPKLILDEQAFEGLLAAAFTIQQHNDRLRHASNTSADKARPTTDAPELCAQCAAPVPTDAASCPVCGAENLRPGERLQRTWASLWQMSREHRVRRAPPENAEAAIAATPSRRDGNGHYLADSDHEVTGPIKNAKPAGANVPTEAANPVADFLLDQSPSTASSLRQPVPDLSREEVALPQRSGRSRSHFSSAALSADEGLAGADRSEDDLLSGQVSPDDLPRDDAALGDALPVERWLAGSSLAHSSLDDSRRRDSSHAGDWQEDSTLASPAAEATDFAPSASNRAFARLREKLDLHRADVYIGVAVLLAAWALLWPASTSPRRHVSPFERVLIAMGVAEAPRPATYYRGDPEIKVWVDPHTALYYCPGDELYGQSPDGHYTTQHEAQADRFEPAQGSACIQ